MIHLTKFEDHTKANELRLKRERIKSMIKADSSPRPGRHLLMMIFIPGIVAIALITFVWMHADLFDKIPVWFWTIFVLVAVASIVLVYRGKKDKA